MLFSVSSQKEQDEKRRQKQRTFQYGCAELPHYTALDAVGWVCLLLYMYVDIYSSVYRFHDSGDSEADVSPQSAAAVLFMQFCRRIHSRLSSGTEPSPIPGVQTAPSTLHKCGYRILLQICESLLQYCNETRVPLMLHLHHLDYLILCDRYPDVVLLCLSVLQYLNVMSCPEEGVCCVCRRGQTDRTKSSCRLRAAAAAAQVAPVFTAAMSRTI